MVKIAIAGLGNCASALIQGLLYYRDRSPAEVSGLMHWEIGGIRPQDIRVVAAFDIDARKVGKDVSEAIFAAPNCTTVFQADIPATGVKVQMGPIMDGVSEHMLSRPEHLRFVPAELPQPDKQKVVHILQKS